MKKLTLTIIMIISALNLHGMNESSTPSKEKEPTTSISKQKPKKKPNRAITPAQKINHRAIFYEAPNVDIYNLPNAPIDRPIYPISRNYPQMAINQGDYPNFNINQGTINTDLSINAKNPKYFPTSCFPSFQTEEPQDIANLLLSVGSVMHKQNSMHRTELEHLKIQAKQAQFDAQQMINFQSQCNQAMQHELRLKDFLHKKELQQKELQYQKKLESIESKHKEELQQKDQLIENLNKRLQELEASESGTNDHSRKTTQSPDLSDSLQNQSPSKSDQIQTDNAPINDIFAGIRFRKRPNDAEDGDQRTKTPKTQENFPYLNIETQTPIQLLSFY